MFPQRIILAVVCCAFPCAADWTPAQKEWGLATSAMLSQMSGERQDLLGGAEQIDEVALEPVGVLVFIHQHELEPPMATGPRLDGTTRVR